MKFLEFLFIPSLFIVIQFVSSHLSETENQALLDFSKQNKTTQKESFKDDREETLKKWQMECFQMSKADPDLVLKLKSGSWKINNRSLKEWVLCMLNKYDLMSMEGVFRQDTAMTLVPRSDWEAVENLIDYCLPTKRDEPREIAWKYAKCYHTSLKKDKNKRFHYMTLF